ncbi:hypothetical protein BK412_07575 [Vibrio campbellii]|uniref:trypsin-like peptidase domain-containing protein n=1 Tax=Vibrio campbellii TaxID=680 RepID=UPI0009C12DE0|nr:trypsin-like peptidase domain-containing protein [Vibrio campbellii]OQQ04839.1 hypothetical protein BK412_07575 [Vibrio campbellii]
MKALGIIVALSSFLTWPSFATPCLQDDQIDLSNEGDLVYRLAPSVFLLERWSEKSRDYIPLGTATVISKSGHLLTAKHLFEYTNTVNLAPDKFRLTHTDRETEKKTSFKVDSIKHHKDGDISIIKVVERNEYSFKPIKLNFDFKAYPSNVKMYSYTLDNPHEPLISSLGSITRKDSSNFIIIDQIKPYNGQSGSLLINENLHGVGVLSGYIVDDGRAVTLYSELREQEFKFIRATSTHLVQEMVSDLEMKDASNLVNIFIENPGPLPESEIKHSLKNNPLSYNLAMTKIVDEHNDVIGRIPNSRLASDFWFQFTSYSRCFLNTNVAKSYSRRIYSSLPKDKVDSIVKVQIGKARKNDNLKESIAYYRSASQLVEMSAELNSRYWANLDYTALEIVQKIKEGKEEEKGTNMALASLIVSERIKGYSNIQHRLTNLQVDSSQQVLLSASQFSQAGESHYAGAQFALAASEFEKYRPQSGGENSQIIGQSKRDFKYHAAKTSLSEPNVPENALINIKEQLSQSVQGGFLPTGNTADIEGAVVQFEINAKENLSFVD